MTREWIALERHEGRAHDLSLYARALHAQLHRWVDGEGRIDARLEGDLCEAMSKSIAFRFGATRGDRRLIAGHLAELVGVGAVVLSADGLELRALADGADLVRHKLAVGDRPQPTKRLRVTSTKCDDGATIGHEASRTSNEASRPETKEDASARNDSVHSPRIEESRREENRGEGESAREAHAPAPQDSLDGGSSTDETPPASAPLSLEGEPSKPRRQRRRAAEPAVDPVPPEGTVARRVYEAITTDVALAPITRGPGDLAMRLAALCDGTNVDPAAEVISAGAWQLRNGRWTDGARGLLGWVKSSADRARSMPAAVVGAPRAQQQPERIDYQGRRAVGAAGLPSGDVWTNERDEEAEAFERIRARTQPKGAMGR